MRWHAQDAAHVGRRQARHTALRLHAIVERDAAQKLGGSEGAEGVGGAERLRGHAAGRAGGVEDVADRRGIFAVSEYQRKLKQIEATETVSCGVPAPEVVLGAGVGEPWALNCSRQCGGAGKRAHVG